MSKSVVMKLNNSVKDVPGSLASVIAALAEDVTINLDAGHADIAFKPVAGDNSLLRATVGTALDAIRILYSLYLEFLDIGELRQGELGGPSQLNLEAFLKPENLSALYDRNKDRGKFLDTFLKKMSPLMMDTLIAVFNTNSNGAITVDTVIRLAELYGQAESCNGIAAKRFSLEYFYKPLFGFNKNGSAVYDHRAAKRSKELALEFIAALWQRIADNVLLGSPHEAEISAQVSGMFDDDQQKENINKRLNRALDRINSGVGLFLSFLDINNQQVYAITDILAQPGLEGKPGTTWLVAPSALLKINNAAAYNAINLEGSGFGKDHPGMTPGISFTGQISIDYAKIVGTYMIVCGYAPTIIITAVLPPWVIVPVPLTADSVTMGVPSGSARFNNKPALVRGTPSDICLIADNDKSSVNANNDNSYSVKLCFISFISGNFGTLDVTIANISNDVPKFVPLTSATYSLSSSRNSYDCLLFPDPDGYLFFLFFAKSSNLSLPWWKGSAIQFALSVSLHPDVQVIGAIGDQIIINYFYSTTDSKTNITTNKLFWAFLPIRTFIPGQWGADKEFFMNILGTKMEIGGALITIKSDPAQTGILDLWKERLGSTGVPGLEFQEGNVSDFHSDMQSDLVSLVCTDDPSVRIYRLYTGIYPTLLNKVFMGHNRDSFRQVSHEIIGEKILTATASFSGIEHQLAAL